MVQVRKNPEGSYFKRTNERQGLAISLSCFMVFCGIGAMNLVTAVVVHSAMLKTGTDNEMGDAAFIREVGQCRYQIDDIQDRLERYCAEKRSRTSVATNKMTDEQQDELSDEESCREQPTSVYCDKTSAKDGASEFPSLDERVAANLGYSTTAQAPSLHHDKKNAEDTKNDFDADIPDPNAGDANNLEDSHADVIDHEDFAALTEEIACLRRILVVFGLKTSDVATRVLFPVLVSAQTHLSETRSPNLAQTLISPRPVDADGAEQDDTNRQEDDLYSHLNEQTISRKNVVPLILALRKISYLPMIVAFIQNATTEKEKQNLLLESLSRGLGPDSALESHSSATAKCF